MKVSFSTNFRQTVPPALQPVFDLAIQRSRLDAMSIHGPSHWMNVYRNATLLAERTPGSDLLVCQHFALLHDCERRNEGHDPQHGPRAAVFARELFEQKQLSLSAAQLELLRQACIGHDLGRISDDPTIGVCWDADRLDLPRVGVRVDKKYLSTAAAKSFS